MTVLMLWSKSTTVSLGPEPLLDLVPGHDLAGPFNQHPQDLEGLLAQ